MKEFKVGDVVRIGINPKLLIVLEVYNDKGILFVSDPYSYNNLKFNVPFSHVEKQWRDM